MATLPLELEALSQLPAAERGPAALAMIERLAEVCIARGYVADRDRPVSMLDFIGQGLTALAEEHITLDDFERALVEHGFDPEAGEYDVDWLRKQLAELARHRESVLVIGPLTPEQRARVMSALEEWGVSSSGHRIEIEPSAAEEG